MGFEDDPKMEQECYPCDCGGNITKNDIGVCPSCDNEACDKFCPNCGVELRFWQCDKCDEMF